ncbi:unnamed protein product [Bursaphelenchus xylophilus]|uniref:(pine wood nematode) hypothetical protein n=1 Tax=Bursaphelenchus xylophilus TaxID=6326 RepID=A0A1I7SSS8_BURXY|nr:unnamed protein product [Bursaphelenchus xylophilus]CAG9108894.1 unnamed protein product [Bursaphelenchus xylophilus]
MSEYLGWRERKPPRELDTTRFDRDILPGGPVSQGFENYVKSIFRPGSENANHTTANAGPYTYHQQSNGQLPAGACGLTGDPKVSASALLKMEEHLGKEALDDSLDHEILYDDALPRMYSELGISSPTERSYRQYPVYNPKTSSEYFALKNSTTAPIRYSTEGYKGAYDSYNEKKEDDWRRTDRQMLVDYKDFNSSPLSPYMYQQHPYVQRQDTRIVGSNFVQLTTRPRDRFLDKIDRTLAEVRAMPRF